MEPTGDMVHRARAGVLGLLCNTRRFNASLFSSTGVFSRLAAKRRSPSFSPAFRQGSFQGFSNFTGNTVADLLRLNLAIPPAKIAPSRSILTHFFSFRKLG